MIRHITIQEIYAKHSRIHTFLKNRSFNNNQHIFFISTVGQPILYMLTENALLYQLLSTATSVELRYIGDDQLLRNAISIVEIAANGKHGYLKPTLDLIKVALE